MEVIEILVLLFSLWAMKHVDSENRKIGWLYCAASQILWLFITIALIISDNPSWYVLYIPALWFTWQSIKYLYSSEEPPRASI